MRAATIVVVIAAAVIAIILIRRELGVGGLFGLTVEERARALRPFAANMLAQAKPAGVLGLGGSVTIHARALIAWAHWKYGYNSAEARAWALAAAWARDTINAHRQDPGRFFEQIALLVSTFVGAVTGGLVGLAGWVGYLGATATAEIERNANVRKAYVDFINAQIRAKDRSFEEFMRILLCSRGAASFWIDHQPTRANVNECARLAIMSEPNRPDRIARNGRWELPGGSLTGG